MRVTVVQVSIKDEHRVFRDRLSKARRFIRIFRKSKCARKSKSAVLRASCVGLIPFTGHS